MRYHTAPLIAFTAYLEGRRSVMENDPKLFAPGKTFSCFINSMRVHKTSLLENTSQYRSYSRLNFTFTHLGYEFELQTGGFLSRTPRGIIRFESGGRYEIQRYGDYGESYVKYSFRMPSATLSGTYYNWHLEQGRFSGRVIDKNVEITAQGPHYRRDKRSPYYRASEKERQTTWVFDVPLSNITFPAA